MFDQWLNDHRNEITDTYVELRLEQGDPRPKEALRQGAGFGIDVSIKSVLGEMNWEQATRAGAKKVLETGGSLDALSETARTLFLAIRKVLEEDRPKKAFEWLGIVGDYTLRGSETVAKVMEENLEDQIAKRTGEAAVFRKFAEASGQGLGWADLDGNTVYVNEALCRILGAEAMEDVVGKKVLEFYPEESRDKMKNEVIPTTVETGQWTGELPLKSRNGQVTPTIQSLFLIRDENENPIYIANLLADITEQKGAEVALEKARATAEEEAKTLKTHIEFILGATNTGLDIIDGDFNIRYIDPEWRKVYGDPKGRKCYEYFMGAKDVCEGCGIIKALETKSIAVTEETLPKEGNRPIQVTTIPFQNEDGEWLVAEVNVDITERKRAEEELKKANDQLEQRVKERTRELEKSEKMFRALTESMHAMVMIASAKEMRAIYANPAATEVTGYSLEELTTSPPPNLFSEKSAEKRDEYMAAYLRGEDLPDRTEMEIITKDGRSRWLETSLALIDMGEDGIHKVTTSFDITERKMTQDALRQSEKKFRALADSTSASIAIVAGEESRFIYANQTMLDRAGITWDELAAIDPHESLTPAAREAGTRAAMEAAERGDTLYSFEYKDNDGKWIQINVTQTELDGESASIYTAFDITDHKRAQGALEESEKKFRGLAESTTAHISIIQDDKYVYANQAFLEYYGVDIDDLQVTTPEDLMMGLLGPEVMKAAEPAWQAAMDQGDTHFRFEFQDVEGTWFQGNVAMMEIDGKPSYMATNFDITEQKRAQQEIAANEKKYRAIFDTAGTAMISFGEDSVITIANEEWIELSGYSKEETIGKLTWVPFFSEKSLAKMKRYHEMRSVDPSSVPDAYEAEFLDRQGRVHEGIVNIQLVPGTQQRVASFLDMAELKRAQNEMYRADKMAALGQIIAGVAHEINNPNNFIYFNLPILRKYIEAIRPLLEHHLEEEPDLKILNMPYEAFLKDVYKLLENMEHGSQRITGIVSELKNYIRSDEVQDMKVERIDKVINQVMALIGKQVRKMVKQFDVEVAEGLAPTKMNPGKIEQVLINLVINAGQAADKDDSWVKLEARPAKDDNGFIEILVEDNGAGVPKENLEQIFEPFFTSKSREAGTGLGLSISHQIIQDHGGTICVDSELGEGTRFTIRLPAHRGE
ncbi:MAG: PAS domain S-box protein [Deltaproteobacteria bacterium]|nr:PAS domain S-box protein [Deltaproteobacteria bacterium]